MSEPIWQSDSFGTYNLYLDGGKHLFIQARPYYCDRGHWSLGSSGFSFIDGIEPSLYFHRMDTAISEAELWAAKLNNQPIFWDCEEPFPNDAKLNWTLKGHTYKTEVKTDDGIIHIQVDALNTELDPLWKLSIEGMENLDGGDGFPRHFLRLEHAISEAEDFLTWRLEKKPIEIPDPIERPEQSLPPYILKALQIKTIHPKL